MKFQTFKNLWWIYIIILLRITNWPLYIFMYPFLVRPPSSTFWNIPNTSIKFNPLCFSKLAKLYLSQSVLYLAYEIYETFHKQICTLNHSTLSVLFTDPLISVSPSFSNTSNLFIKSQLHPTADVYPTLHPITVTNPTP